MRTLFFIFLGAGIGFALAKRGGVTVTAGIQTVQVPAQAPTLASDGAW